jgi:hypothetical protein
MFNNFSTVGWNIMKPTNAALPIEGSPMVLRVQLEAPYQIILQNQLVASLLIIEGFCKELPTFFLC